MTLEDLGHLFLKTKQITVTLLIIHLAQIELY
jgi:hypothetical protein